MPLGKTSKDRLATCHPDIQRFVEAVADGIDAGMCPEVKDIAVLCGWRGEADQNLAYARKTSKLQWPDSKHNVMLPDGSPNSHAVDMAPYPIDWTGQGLPGFRALRKYALSVAKKLGIKIRVISWDLPHYELL